ncbi:transmembrane protein, putative (macronuclear) [Tetrahymena thermophila SB210]|uniref:Transmembrane protein, putative n=1 Tax=Tetrahymena thermophila (strain SB210) TaxID=312017 RepID=W7XL95_TETTS|nr:transmembrane protein, putative [Tetrahymena thermophila SB210]EWS75899.1 transmembrane protein, putative [Tetrahymena thermophila SB210]|eukprot:XP_012651570.1 transmembrane protein, putative [Tetrahymena thermophila SB210]
MTAKLFWQESRFKGSSNDHQALTNQKQYQIGLYKMQFLIHFLLNVVQCVKHLYLIFGINWLFFIFIIIIIIIIILFYDSLFEDYISGNDDIFVISLTDFTFLKKQQSFSLVSRQQLEIALIIFPIKRIFTAIIFFILIQMDKNLTLKVTCFRQLRLQVENSFLYLILFCKQKWHFDFKRLYNSILNVNFIEKIFIMLSICLLFFILNLLVCVLVQQKTTLYFNLISNNFRLIKKFLEEEKMKEVIQKMEKEINCVGLCH